MPENVHREIKNKLKIPISNKTRSLNVAVAASISAAVTSVSVVGPGLGNIIGPEESFGQLPSTLKLLLSFGMVLGRLEYLAFLIILAPKFWIK